MGEEMKAMTQLELAEKGIQVAKQVETIDAVDRNAAKIVDAAGDLAVGKMQPKKPKGEIIAERLPNVMDAADAGAANIVTVIADIIVKYIWSTPAVSAISRPIQSPTS